MEDLPVSVMLVCREVKESRQDWLKVKEVTAKTHIKKRGKRKGEKMLVREGMYELGWVCNMQGAKWQMLLRPE